MNLKYINKIKANVMIYASNKSVNLLDGTYNSIYKGKSSNFEDLREYVIGDNIKDIDWKASARSGVTLVRQFRAEKKHNIMMVLDTGKKMQADSKMRRIKKRSFNYDSWNDFISCKLQWRLCWFYLRKR